MYAANPGFLNQSMYSFLFELPSFCKRNLQGVIFLLYVHMEDLLLHHWSISLKMNRIKTALLSINVWAELLLLWMYPQNAMALGSNCRESSTVKTCFVESTKKNPNKMQSFKSEFLTIITAWRSTLINPCEDHPCSISSLFLSSDNLKKLSPRDSCGLFLVKERVNKIKY